MPKVRMNYDGWIALPPAARRELGLSIGDQLEIEIANCAVVLRPARGPSAADRAVTEAAFTAARAVVEAPAPAAPEPAIVQPQPAAPELAPTATPSSAVKRGPGRPRKAPAAALPPALKTRGRRGRDASRGVGAASQAVRAGADWREVFHGSKPAWSRLTISGHQRLLETAQLSP